MWEKIFLSGLLSHCLVEQDIVTEAVLAISALVVEVSEDLAVAVSAEEEAEASEAAGRVVAGNVNNLA